MDRDEVAQKHERTDLVGRPSWTGEKDAFIQGGGSGSSGTSSGKRTSKNQGGDRTR